jgi:tetratricopeptide (TPR) repeat protein/predicted Ser/Thr protein kinase
MNAASMTAVASWPTVNDVADARGLARTELDDLSPERRVVADVMKRRLFPGVTTPAKIGRFTVLETLGEGGMGVVFAAYDDQLDRRVAVKLIRSRRGPDATIRVMREAQALARLAHPNVVGVHEVGEHHDSMFVAMEYVAGRTLRDWLAACEGPRPWRETLAVLIQAGRGLEAAHLAGLVHRDFKPENVIVGDDGRARVLDFGLVRGVEGVGTTGTLDEYADSVDEGPVDEGTRDGGVLLRSLTVSGTVLGTPAYMAPEQHRGAKCDALADQFAFCVTAFEALYGVRPFAGRSLAELRRAVLAGEVVDPPHELAVPKRVHAGLLRGLAPTSEGRWPSVTALLAELEGALVAPRRRALGLVGGLVLGAVAATGASRALNVDASPCEGAAAELDASWSEARASALVDGFAISERPWAQATAQLARLELERWAERWRAERVAVCEASADARAQQRLHCLDDRRARFDRTVALLVAGGDMVIDAAPRLLAALPDIEVCSHLESLAAELPLPAEGSGDTLRAVEEFRARLEEIALLLDVGRLDEAAAELQRARGAAPPWPPARAELDLLAARLTASRRVDAAEDAYQIAVEAALDADHRAVLREAWIRQALLVSGVRGDPRAAARLLDQAESLTSGAARVDVMLELVRAQALTALGRRDDAEAAFARALAANDAREPSNQLMRAAILRERSELWFERQDWAAARRDLGDALEIYAASFGPVDHPEALSVRLELVRVALEDGTALSERAAVAERIAALERGFVAISGPDASELVTLGLARTRLASLAGDLEAARRAATAASERCRRLASETLDCRNALAARGTIAFYLGDFAEAEQAFAAAVELFTRVEGPRAESVGLQRSNYGEALLARGRPDDALVEFEAALSIFDETDARAMHRALPTKGRGQALLALGRAEQAVTALEQALVLVGDDPPEAADVRWSLARALARAEPPQRERAEVEARRALLVYRELGPDFQPRVDAITAWLR